MSSRAQGKILVIRGGAIGDFLLTLPVCMALRRQFPQTHIEVLGYAHIAQLALIGELANAVRSIEARPLAGFFAKSGTLDPEWQDYFAGFALIISYLFDPDGIFRENIARCSKAQFIAGPHRPHEQAGVHATEVFLKPLEQLAIFDADPEPCLRFGEREPGGNAALPPGTCDRLQFASGHGVPPLGGETGPIVQSRDPGAENYSSVPPAKAGTPCQNPHPVAHPTDSSLTGQPTLLAAHPGSGSERKNWPENKWAELFEALGQTPGLKLLLVGGEAEGDRLERLAAKAPSGRCELARSLPLVALARRLCQCAAFVGHDSGITHLAAALGLPVLALWGDTAEQVWRPRSRHTIILRDPNGLDALPVQVVRDHIALRLAKGSAK